MSNAYNTRFFNPRLKIVAVLLSCLFTVPVLAERADVRSKDLAQMIYTGQFLEAQELLTSQPPILEGRSTRSLDDALTNYSRLSHQREEVRIEAYDENVELAKEYLAKANDEDASDATTQAADEDETGDADEPISTRKPIERSLTAARKARFYAPDVEQFAQLDWVLQIAEESKILAQQYMDEHEWLKAGNIYAELATIFEDDKVYEKLTRDCAMRVRLEATYKPKSDWAEQIRDIKIDIIPELGFHIATYYVDQPDFSKITLAGLRTIGTFTEVPKLNEVFPVLDDQEKVQLFDQQMRLLIDQVEAESQHAPLTIKEFWQVFIKLIVINDETLELPQEVIIKEFANSALSELDPFTSVIWPAEMEDFEKQITGRFSGVGIQITMENNKLKVITPIPGSPAFDAEIVPGDLIVTIDGESTEGITIEQAVRRITGPKGTSVVLGILHPWTDEIRDIPLTRDTIVIQTVKGHRMDDENKWQYFVDPDSKDIAYIRLTNFTDTTISELKNAIKVVQEQNAKGLILDLRFNPGGTLKAAVDVVNLFISEGVIVSTKGRHVESFQPIADSQGPQIDLPMVVLINGSSASASEIVAGALRDYHRAWLIGERTYGKGSVQNVLPLVKDTAKMKLTTAYYYLPLGQCIHRKPDSKEGGVDPNLAIELTPQELRDILELQRDAEIISKGNDMDPTTMPATRSVPDEDDPDDDLETTPKERKYPPVDVHLHAAMAVMQARLSLEFPWEEIPTTVPAASDDWVAQNQQEQ